MRERRCEGCKCKVSASEPLRLTMTSQGRKMLCDLCEEDERSSRVAGATPSPEVSTTASVPSVTTRPTSRPSVDDAA